VIYDYEDYNNGIIFIKTGTFVSTEMFKKNFRKYVYDAFIFGSSLHYLYHPAYGEITLIPKTIYFLLMLHLKGSRVYGQKSDILIKTTTT
jgi:hypothetical protein